MVAKKLLIITFSLLPVYANYNPSEPVIQLSADQSRDINNFKRCTATFTKKGMPQTLAALNPLLKETNTLIRGFIKSCKNLQKGYLDQAAQSKKTDVTAATRSQPQIAFRQFQLFFNQVTECLKPFFETFYVLKESCELAKLDALQKKLSFEDRQKSLLAANKDLYHALKALVITPYEEALVVFKETQDNALARLLNYINW